MMWLLIHCGLVAMQLGIALWATKDARAARRSEHAARREANRKDLGVRLAAALRMLSSDVDLDAHSAHRVEQCERWLRRWSRETKRIRP